MTTSSKLMDLNNLTYRKGFWVLDRPTQFNYTDGEGAELFLKRVVSEARDISSQSLELETCYPDWDWVSEYHLSYKRANLLRGVDLSKIKNVLEIGCGCGAITRYLGEKGICVDAIEGAQRRADIAQLRCRNLQNINIINANYNDLKLPHEAYDAIFIIGVIEYAGQFLSEASNDEAAVVIILKQLQQALRKKGALVIAIENRNGLKYWLGATEDHYGQPYVGLTNYWGRSGTKTYSYDEWPALLKEAGIAYWHFQFPFPDYKLPQVILDQDFIDHDENAYSLLYRITSRDYLRPWQPGTNEFTLWRALHQSNQLKEYANSFLIVTGQDEACLRELLPADFTYFSGGSRKPEFRTVTLKAHQTDQVRKKYLWVSEKDSRKALTHQITKSPYIKGSLLSTIWLETLLASDTDQFQLLLEQYCKFITQQIDHGVEETLIDALPANIVVDSENHYHIIDQEWQTDRYITVEFLLFRALLWFGHDNQQLLTAFFQSKNITCLSEFIEFGFDALSTDTSSILTSFVHREDTIQFKVSGQKNLRPIQQLITTPFVLAEVKTSIMKLYWAAENQAYSDTRSCEVCYHYENGSASIRVPFTSDRRVSRLRIMPLYQASENKLLLFKNVSLTQIVKNNGDEKVIWQVQSASQWIKSVQHNHYVVSLIKPEGAFILNNKRATLDFLVTDTPNSNKTYGRLFELKLIIIGEAHLGPSFITEHLNRRTDAINREFNKYQQTILEANDFAPEKTMAKIETSDKIQRLKAQRYADDQQLRASEAKIEVLKSELKETRKFLRQLAQVKFIKGAGHVLPGKYGWLNSGLNQYNRFHLNKADYDQVKDSGLFDETFYQEYKPDLKPFNSDPLRHYLLFGGFNGLNPNRLFDTPFYLKQCPELVTEKLNPLIHFLSIGAATGKNPCYLFDTQYYLDQHCETIEKDQNPLGHYFLKGSKKYLDPHPAFDTIYYIDQYSDFNGNTLTPLEHFFLFGEADQISPTALFDWNYYLEVRPNLINEDISAFRHFIEYGYKEGGEPSPVFDTNYYFQPDSSDLKFKINPISHYIKKGRYENRSPNPYFDPQYYRGQLNPEDIGSHDPFSHYLWKGEISGVNAHPLLDTLYYRSQLAKIDIHPDSPLGHFFKKGFDNSSMSHPLLEPGYCLAQLPYDGKSAIGKLIPYYHENTYGAAQNPHPLFDSEYYRSQLEPEDAGHVNPLFHYVKKGCNQKLSTHPEFDPEYYTSQDLAPCLKEGQSPVAHYIYHGAKTQKWPNKAIEKLEFKPQLSVILLLDGPDFNYLSGRILSVISQLYPCWRLSVVARNPDDSDDYCYARAMAGDDSRIHWVETDDNDSAANLLNQALEISTGEYVVFLGEQMYLKANAFLTFVHQLNINRDLALVHTDRNQNDPNSIPIGQPDENFNGLTTHFYIGPLACLKRSLIDQMGGFATYHQSAYDDRFLTHYLHQVPSNSVKHIAEPLHFTMAKDPLHVFVRKNNS